jgi:hypothetical protein
VCQRNRVDCRHRVAAQSQAKMTSATPARAMRRRRRRSSTLVPGAPCLRALAMLPYRLQSHHRQSSEEVGSPRRKLCPGDEWTMPRGVCPVDSCGCILSHSTGRSGVGKPEPFESKIATVSWQVAFFFSLKKMERRGDGKRGGGGFFLTKLESHGAPS